MSFMNNHNLQASMFLPVKLSFKVTAWFFELLSDRKRQCHFNSVPRDRYLDRASLVRCSSSSCSSPSLQQERSKHVSSRKDLISSSFSEITRYLQRGKKKKAALSVQAHKAAPICVTSVTQLFLLSTYAKTDRNEPAARSNFSCAVCTPHIRAPSLVLEQMSHFCFDSKYLTSN